MDIKYLTYIATLRAVVGFLGESAEFGYWPSKFFSPEAEAFLSPVFPRTRFLACLTGVTEVAARSHDARIGVGNVFHLFRLPEDIEQAIHELVGAEPPAQLVEAAGDEHTAMEYLRLHSAIPDSRCDGPTVVGPISTLRHVASWSQVAALYLAAFEGGHEVFPYFSGDQ